MVITLPDFIFLYVNCVVFGWTPFVIEIDVVPLYNNKLIIKFTSDNALADHVRRNTGEPIHLPPHSLSPAQSQHMEEEARQAVAHVTEEYRRFRVRAEVARKQTDATMRAMQSNNVQTAQKHIEGQDLLSELEQAKQDHEQVHFLRAELVVNREGFCSAPIIQKKKTDTNILFLSSAVFGNPCLAQASQDVRGQSAKTLRCFFRLPADACMGSMTIPC